MLLLTHWSYCSLAFSHRHNGVKHVYFNPNQLCTKLVQCHLQYIPRNMHTVFALLCFVVVIHWPIFPYPSGLLHWHWGNLTIAPVPAKQPWWIWINTSCEFIMNDCMTTTKQSTTKPCAYFLGYTVYKYNRSSDCVWIVRCFFNLSNINVILDHFMWNFQMTGLVGSQHLPRQLFGAVSQYVISYTNVDQVSWRYMVCLS